MDDLANSNKENDEQLRQIEEKEEELKKLKEEFDSLKKSKRNQVLAMEDRIEALMDDLANFKEDKDTENQELKRENENLNKSKEAVIEEQSSQKRKLEENVDFAIYQKQLMQKEFIKQKHILEKKNEEQNSTM